MMNTPITILSLSSIDLSIDRTPRIKNVVELQYPKAKIKVWKIDDSKKQRAVIGTKIVRL